MDPIVAGATPAPRLKRVLGLWDIYYGIILISPIAGCRCLARRKCWRADTRSPHCGLAGHLGAVRLLYGMGRDNLLPQKVFGYIDARRGNPSYNVVIVGLLAYIGTVTLRWERAVEILNFGALLAFMAVNAAALKHFAFGNDPERKVNLLLDVISPALGFLFCLAIFLGLQSSTLAAGAIWLVVGGVYLLLKTRGMSTPAIEIDFNES